MSFNHSLELLSLRRRIESLSAEGRRRQKRCHLRIRLRRILKTGGELGVDMMEFHKRFQAWSTVQITFI